jgi:hypothetical protein
VGTQDSNLEGAERIYGFFLRLYPPGFRRRYGPEMVQIFRDIYQRDVRNASFAGRLALWLRTIHDLACSLPGEWRQSLRSTNRIELPVRQWADSLVVPLIVIGSLLVAGNLGATLARNLTPSSTVHTSGDAGRMASMLITGVAVALGLGVLGLLRAMIAACNRRAESGIKL